VEQACSSLEIVVSDNASSDETRSVVGRFQDSRIRYVNTGKALSMPKSWEFALNAAQGEWISILSDDSVLSPALLKELYPKIADFKSDFISWPYARYYFPSWPKTEEKNSLHYLPFKGGTRRLSSREELKRLYKSSSFIASSPSIYKGFCHRSVIDRARKRSGVFFDPPAPDYSAAAATLFLTEGFTFIDRPYTIMGTAKESIGESSNQDRGEAFQRFIAEFEGENIFSHVPLPLYVTRNIISEALLRTSQSMGEKIEVDWPTYFKECYRDLLRLSANGISIDNEKTILFDYLEQHDMKRVKQELAQVTVLEDRNWKKAFGDREGFSNILEGMSYLDSKVRVAKRRNSPGVWLSGLFGSGEKGTKVAGEEEPRREA